MAAAISAADAIPNAVHFFLIFFREPLRRGTAANHLDHTRAVVDLNSRRARHTIAAAAAKIALQAFAVRRNQRGALRGHKRLLTEKR